MNSCIANLRPGDQILFWSHNGETPDYGNSLGAKSMIVSKPFVKTDGNCCFYDIDDNDRYVIISQHIVGIKKKDAPLP